MSFQLLKISQELKLKISIFFVSGFYIGFIPIAPGTFGSLPGILFALLLNYFNKILSLILFLSIFLISVFTTHFVCEKKDLKDPPFIVIDEILGMSIALIDVDMSILNIVLAFVIFRFFDIIKPYPISLVDRKIPGGLGIMLDDILSGICTNIIMIFISRF